MHTFHLVLTGNSPTPFAMQPSASFLHLWLKCFRRYDFARWGKADSHSHIHMDAQNCGVRKERCDLGVGVGENMSSVPRGGADWPTNRWHWSGSAHKNYRLHKPRTPTSLTTTASQGKLLGSSCNTDQSLIIFLHTVPSPK